MEIFISSGHAVEGRSCIFLNVFTNFSIKGVLKTFISVANKIIFLFLEQLKPKYYGKKILDFLSLGKKKAFPLLLSEILSYVLQRVGVEPGLPFM